MFTIYCHLTPNIFCFAYNCKLKNLITLVIAVSLEVENVVDNLWKQGPGQGFKNFPDCGQRIPQNHFCPFQHDFSHF